MYVVENSQRDWIGVYVAPIQQVVSLFPPVCHVDSKQVHETPSITFATGNKIFF